MQYRQLFFYLFIALSFFPVASYGLLISYDNSGAVWYTDKIHAVGTYGDDMAGMTVTVTFSDSGTTTTEEVRWNTAESHSGGASSSNWSLAVTGGSTYLNLDPESVNKFAPWIFTVKNNNISVSQIFIDAGTGNTVFDTVSPNTKPSTNGSESGDPLDFGEVDDSSATATYSWKSAEDSWNTIATYSGRVALAGQAPVGDLYRYLSIDFGEDTPLTESFSFRADTDTIKSALVVPEPTTLVLFGIGLAGLAGLASRKRRA